MKCPACGSTDTRVVDSRLTKDGNAIRRRRECERCERRFTTYERLEEVFPLLVKKDGRREPYDRNKMVLGLQKALEKRPVSADVIEAIADRVATGEQHGARRCAHRCGVVAVELDALLGDAIDRRRCDR